MRKTKRSGNFFICLMFNMLINLDGLLPSVVLMALHFWLDISVWWSVIAAVLWLLRLIFWMKFIGWAGKCSNIPESSKENKNPYSVGNNYMNP